MKIKNLKHFFLINMYFLITSGSMIIEASTENKVEHDFDYYKNKIIMNILTVDEDELILSDKRKEEALKNAISTYNARFTQTFSDSPGGKKAKDGTLSGNYLCGIAYYNTKDAKPTGYGSEIWAAFRNTECDFSVNGPDGFGTVSFPYRFSNQQVAIFTRFNQLVLKSPYPFPKHIFKAQPGNGTSINVNRTIELMNVPRPRTYLNFSDEEAYENLKGRRFVGFTSNKNKRITMNSGEETSPVIYTVVEFRKDGYVTITYPAFNEVVSWNDKYSVKNGIIHTHEISYTMESFVEEYPDLPESYYRQAEQLFSNYYVIFGTLQNNGAAINNVSPVEGYVFMLSEVKKGGQVQASSNGNTAQHDNDIKLIKKFYQNAVFYDENFSEAKFKTVIKECLTPEMIKRLHQVIVDEYGPDDVDPDALGTNVLRTGAQDGDGPSKIIDITYLGNKWYKVTFLDMGNKGTKEIKMENGKIADYRN